MWSYIKKTVEGSNLYPFEDEARLNDNQDFIPYLKENTTLHHYKDKLFSAV
jgi:hypothetical protein